MSTKFILTKTNQLKNIYKFNRYRCISTTYKILEKENNTIYTTDRERYKNIITHSIKGYNNTLNKLLSRTEINDSEFINVLGEYQYSFLLQQEELKDNLKLFCKIQKTIVDDDKSGFIKLINEVVDTKINLNLAQVNTLIYGYGEHFKKHVEEQDLNNIVEIINKLHCRLIILDQTTFSIILEAIHNSTIDNKLEYMLTIRKHMKVLGYKFYDAKYFTPMLKACLPNNTKLDNYFDIKIEQPINLLPQLQLIEEEMLLDEIVYNSDTIKISLLILLHHSKNYKYFLDRFQSFDNKDLEMYQLLFSIGLKHSELSRKNMLIFLPMLLRENNINHIFNNKFIETVSHALKCSKDYSALLNMFKYLRKIKRFHPEVQFNDIVFYNILNYEPTNIIKNKYHYLIEEMETYDLDLNKCLVLYIYYNKVHQIVKSNQLCIQLFNQYFNQVNIIESDASPMFQFYFLKKYQFNELHQLILVLYLKSILNFNQVKYIQMFFNNVDLDCFDYCYVTEEVKQDVISKLRRLGLNAEADMVDTKLQPKSLDRQYSLTWEHI